MHISIDSDRYLNHYQAMSNQVRQLAARNMIVRFHWKRAPWPFDYLL